MNRAQRRAEAARARKSNTSGDDLDRLVRAAEEFFDTAHRGDPAGVIAAIETLSGEIVAIVHPVPSKWIPPQPWDVLRFAANGAFFSFAMRDEFVSHLRAIGDLQMAQGIEDAQAGHLPVFVAVHGQGIVKSLAWHRLSPGGTA